MTGRALSLQVNKPRERSASPPLKRARSADGHELAQAVGEGPASTIVSADRVWLETDEELDRVWLELATHGGGRLGDGFRRTEKGEAVPRPLYMKRQ